MPWFRLEHQVRNTLAVFRLCARIVEHVSRGDGSARRRQSALAVVPESQADGFRRRRNPPKRDVRIAAQLDGFGDDKVLRRDFSRDKLLPLTLAKALDEREI